MEITLEKRLLIEGLLLEAGRIFEDGSPELALALPNDTVEIYERIERLGRYANNVAVLAEAARALLASGGE